MEKGRPQRHKGFAANGDITVNNDVPLASGELQVGNRRGIDVLYRQTRDYCSNCFWNFPPGRDHPPRLDRESPRFLK